MIDNLFYEGRLDGLDLFSLKWRRLGGDMMERCKIMGGIDRESSEKSLLLLEMSLTQGQMFQGEGRRFGGDLRNNIFTKKMAEI